MSKPLFKEVSYSLSKLMNDIEMGEIGLETDGFENEDKMDLHLGNLIKSQLGPSCMVNITPKFESYKEDRILLVYCRPSKIPVYLKNGNEEEFYIRADASSAKLTPSQMIEYVKQRFR